MSAILLSDVHLRDATSIKAQLMIRFFQQVASRFERIYILGDLFDVWPGTSPYLVRQFGPVLNTLAQLVRDGREVHYVEGNHDFRLGKVFSDDFGIRVYPNELVETWNGRRIFMAHGDLGNPREKGYRVLRKVLRSPVVHGAVSRIPPEWIYRLGDHASRFSRSFQKKMPPNADKVRGIYRESAQTYFERGYDVVIMGHTHFPDHQQYQVQGRQCDYYNLGDWVKHFTYLEFDGSGFYTKTHPVKNL